MNLNFLQTAKKLYNISKEQLSLAYISPWKWEIVSDNGKTVYEQNSQTGERRAWQRAGGYQPFNQAWLDGHTDILKELN